MCMTFGHFWRICLLIKTDFHLHFNYTHLMQPVTCCTHHISTSVRLRLHWPLTVCKRTEHEEPWMDHSCSSFNTWFTLSIYGLVRLPAAVWKRLSKQAEGMLLDRYTTSKQIHALLREFVTTGEEKVTACVTCSFNYTVCLPVQLGMWICNR